MPETTLQAEPRADIGSAESRRLRAAGRVPAVVYGHGAEPLLISIDARELRHALSGASGSNTLVDLHIGASRHLTIAREMQVHPVRHTVNHVDFQVVSRDEVVSAEVSLQLVGEAVEVSRAGATVEHVVQNLTVHARPGDIPTVIAIDISSLAVGQTLHVSDLPEIPGVRYDAEPDTVIVTVPAPRGAPGEGEEAGAGAGEVAGGSEP